MNDDICEYTLNTDTDTIMKKPFNYCWVCISCKPDLTFEFIRDHIQYLSLKCLTRSINDEAVLEKLLPWVSEYISIYKDLSKEFIERNIENLSPLYLSLNKKLGDDLKIKAVQQMSFVDINRLSLILCSDNDTRLISLYKKYLNWDLISKFLNVKDNFKFCIQMYEEGYFNITHCEYSYMFIVYRKLKDIKKKVTPDICIVCFEGENTEKIVLDCHPNHAYHLECLENIILTGQFNCPICRKNIEIFE